MDRVAAMLILLGLLVASVFMLLALFAYAPIFCSCLLSLLYTLYLFMAYEEHGVHHAQERENQFWTIFALLGSTAMFFADDSPIAFGKANPSLGFFSVLLATYAMHTWDRMVHRREISRQVSIRRTGTASSSLTTLKSLGIPVEDQLKCIHACLADIDQLLIPSTLNNFINLRFVMTKERQIITIFEECDARALNYLVSHVKLGLLFYKIKDHRNFASRHRTELIQMLASDRLPILTVMSRVIVLHALQLMKLRANPRAESWVRNVILNTHQDDLSDLKTLTDAKGDYFCMNKLIYDDIKSETTRQDILTHIRKEATVQRHHFLMGTKKKRVRMQSWRKVLSDVDDTLCSSGGSYPAGIDKRFAKKVVYPGVLTFYRELDLGTQGPGEWPENRVGNLVFLSARPHVYKDVSEKINFAKFEKLRVTADGRQGLHTTPSLLAGDTASGFEYMMRNDMEPLAVKKFDNFSRYVNIYPEYNHVFVCDNGQGDVRAGELMFDAFPYEFEALYVHIVQDISKTHGYAPDRWREKGFKPFFFRTYPEAALDAVKREPPLMRINGLRRVCVEAVQDFLHIEPKKWLSMQQKAERRQELNQCLWEVNNYLSFLEEESVPLIEAEQLWSIGEKVRTPYGFAKIRGFDPIHDLYEVVLDWRPLSQQVEDHLAEEAKQKAPRRPEPALRSSLQTVVEDDEHEDEPSSHAIDDEAEAETPISALTPPDKRPEKDADDATDATKHSTSMDAVSMEEDSSAYVSATIQSRLISKYIPPLLPKVKKDSGPRFSFFAQKTEEDRKATERKATFKPGERCRTPYGLGVVEEHREQSKIVVLKMEGWEARAYLNEESLEIVSKSLLQSLFGSPERVKLEKAKPLEFPYAEGTVIKTPFGEGNVVRPLPLSTSLDSNTTIGIALTRWTLANDTHPTIFCTVDTARSWKDNKGKHTKSTSDAIFSTLGNLVSKTLFEPFATREKKPLPPLRFEQYYKDGAAVSTSFGPGVVRRFREADGFYEISLVRWKLAHGVLAKAILRKDDINHRVADGCIEGYPVLTDLGLTGTLASVDPTTGVHIVTIASAGMVCYLQPGSVTRPLKAAVGEEVLTAYGDGTISRYQIDNDTYEIELHGWKAKLYGKAETFDRAGDGIQQRDTFFGTIFNMFFASDNAQQGVTRSRSNSVASVARSTSGRSVK